MIKIDDLIDEVYNSSVDNFLYDEFINLDTNNQILVIKIIQLSFKQIIVDLISNKLPIHLPYIGTLKIKDGNKIALKNMQIVAKEFNCDLYSNIPDDKLDEAKELLFKLNMEDKLKLKEYREEVRLENKKKKQQAKVYKTSNPNILTFNINNIK